MISTQFSEIIRTIIIMSISGGALALILFALKPIIRHRLPKSAQYYLWLVALAALLVPVSKLVILPETPLNVPIAPIHAVVKQNVITVAEETTKRPQENMNTAAQADTNIPISESTAPTIPSIMSSQNPVITATTIFMMVYPCVALVVLLYNIFSYVIFTRKVRRHRTRAGKDELYEYVGLCGDAIPPRLYRSAVAVTPMLIGIFKPEIILPDREYTNAELHSVLRHELTHLRRRDIVVKWLSVLVCALHWFNPIVWFMRREIDRACELSCDEAVIRNFDSNDKQNYGNTLISVAADVKAPRTVLSTTMCEEKEALKDRLNAIMKYQKRTWITLVCSTVIIVMAAGVVCVLGAGTNTPSVDAAAVISTVEVSPPSTPIPGSVTTSVVTLAPTETAEPTVSPEPAKENNEESMRITAVVFDDPLVEKIIRDALDIPSGDVTNADMLKIETLNLDSPQEDESVSSIDVVKYCFNLREISVSHDIPQLVNGQTASWLAAESDLSDISALEKLSKLETIRLCYTQVTDITPLKGHVNLKALTLSRYGRQELIGLEIISDFTRLEVLVMEGFNVPDTSFVAKLQELTYLSFWWCDTKDILALQSLSKLESLQIGGLKSGDITPLKGLKHLQWVNFADFEMNKESISLIKDLNFNSAGLYRLGLTEEDIADIKKAHPDYNITK